MPPPHPPTAAPPGRPQQRAPGQHVRPASDGLRRRRIMIVAAVIVAALFVGAYTLDWWAGASDDELVVPEPSPTTEPSVQAAAPRSATVPTPEPTPEPTEEPPVLSLPGDFPTSGPGTFTFFDGRESDVLGESGELRRFRVAVEDGIDEDADEIAEFVVDVLGHEQGWTAGGDVQFQLVPADARHDYTLYLTTSQTTAQLCAETGLDVIGYGLPEGGVSCRTPGRTILNYSRWRLSVEHYVDAEVPLETYRQMLVNHEVGHELGHGHYGCPGEGEPAPVMQQQTIFLDGCEANPWPYLDGTHHTGPPVT